MDALEDFIEFWVGKRQPEYGVREARTLAIPQPLQRLHAFAGCWPHPKYWRLFSCQDHLIDVGYLKEQICEGSEKLIFLSENQGVWSCATERQGQDPPVWMLDKVFGEGWEIIHSSLSKFLVTYCLQELTVSSKYRFSRKIVAFLLHQGLESQPLWLNRKYVKREPRFYLLDSYILIMNDFWYVTNNEAIAEKYSDFIEEVDEYTAASEDVLDQDPIFVSKEYGDYFENSN
ncbi:MAG: hypothetical protein F6J87_13205 [Spirulina sp. SIO3F2]|nr:hypothetical protein [Spirulina sp. SIO3F2]